MHDPSYELSGEERLWLAVVKLTADDFKVLIERAARIKKTKHIGMKHVNDEALKSIKGELRSFEYQVNTEHFALICSFISLDASHFKTYVRNKIKELDL